MIDRAGQLVGNYRLVHLLAQGPNSQVYLGVHVHLQMQVAIKVLNERALKSGEQNKIFAEAQTLSQLSHPNIIRMLDFGLDTSHSNNQSVTPYIVMEYAPGGSLRERYSGGIQVPLSTVVSYISQIADALQYTHSQNIVHGDIKPGKMLLGKNDQILLSYFVYVNDVDDEYNEVLIGTPAYLAPELILGRKKGPASDQYSLAVVTYEWMSGFKPFIGGDEKLIAQHVQLPPPRLTEKFPFISKGLEQVVMKALSKEPEQRYPTVKEFSEALEHEEKVTAMRQKPEPNSEETLPTSPNVGEKQPVALSPPSQLPGSSYVDFHADTLKGTDFNKATAREIYGKLQMLSTQEQKEILVKAMGSLSIKDKNEITQEVGVRALTQEATDYIWKIVVSGGVIVFVASAIGIVIAAFVGVNVAPLITVFTAVVAFLGGLLAPSPVQNAIRTLSSGFKSSSKTENE